VVVPAAVRRLLGVGSGDRVLFVSDEQGVYLTSPKALVHAVWANNPQGPAEDSADNVRHVRDADHQHEVERIGELLKSDPADDRTDDEFVDALFTSLDLTQ
jgi:bifunctional DNA-binding transcriptional regulator/antitoxin component of YhaV-PrlF toxin-antitoxin module